MRIQTQRKLFGKLAHLGAVLHGFHQRSDIGNERCIAVLKQRGNLWHATVNGKVRQADGIDVDELCWR